MTTNRDTVMPPPSREQWLADRRQGIGGSDLAAVLGLSKWKTPYDVWADKTGRHTEPENDDMRRGRLLEPVIRAMYEERHGVTLTDPGHMQATEPLIMGTPDAMDGDRVVEFKSTRWYVHKRWQGEPPVDYWAQMQHYMYLTGAREAVLVVLVDGADYHEYPVAYDEAWTRDAIRRAVQWWEAYVVTDTPPPSIEPVPEPVTGETATVDSAIRDTIKDLLDIRDLEDRIKDQREQLEAVVKDYMKGATTLVDGERAVATWKEVTSSRIDTKALRAENPLVADRYTKTTTTRTFRLTR